ncbi:MAG: hypothetical protein A2268_06025 [Candidatus Raymondbacteria bacterium RifOxyA12_full_50_37]|uniref:FlgD Ig-like domain-containing protein n=1 Tax=Candidatus Raymondbacteria bacterium RIFOXYD12_FULL_49_13 TaxID=1817890 RepID=A0A1F7FJW0_UNCRA|nr:MAG: hypothetical protein A2268_06025 [Candidatus Raymondbacteria bacterium RifOxyA12_full_50_37]OGJ94526.1 MAG: hypothetical protein A2248_14955 [Candidatus Raymondbacteria bacterium RIFOXYA2_FULL_49_16]OGK07004.1 MAG: hypothetical protein A2519_13595 [Candidatus Raymondbacteria bacterium RIFOXYD12_FULL_49_13]OGP45475.1 MAG: hypothetical protein A2324_15035 [Candidatus Raymondbacteria bacterium RIFOXYB2_FULL_49_35]
MKTILVFALLSFSSLVIGQTVSLNSFPQKLQFFARDAHDSAIVPVAGSVTSLGSDSIILTILKNGSPWARFSQDLTYSGDSAPFTFNPRIYAELASYKFELRVDATLASNADSVLCGDAFLVDGQSNAASSGVTYYSPWLRHISLTDTTWHRSWSTPWDLGKTIIENQAIPVCFFNGAVGATAIVSHLRDTTLTSIYGKLFFLITRAGLRNGIRAMLWYQGESEGGDSLYNAVGYANNFKAIHDAWKTDCPSITNFYVFQIRPGCGSVRQDILRDCQRRLPALLPDVSLMSTTNVAGRSSDNCHFVTAGYQEMGGWMYRLMSRDLYGSADTVNITPPDIQRAFYADNARTRLVLQFDQPVLLPADASMKNYFSLRREYGQEWGVADSLSADTAAHTVTLHMHNNASEGDAVSYIPPEYDPFTGLNYNGPWLSNTRGIGPLTFFHFSIDNTDPLDSLTATSMQAFAHDSVLEQYDTTRVSAVIAYSTGKIDTTEKECVYTSLNTFLATVSVFGQVIAKNTGTARIRVSKQGFLDTVSIRIVSTTAILDSIRLSEHEKNTALIGFTMTATGYFQKGAERFFANIDTVAVWASTNPSIVSVVKGTVKQATGAATQPIPVTATLQGIYDTCRVFAPFLVPRADMTVTASDEPYSSSFAVAYTVDSTRNSYVSRLAAPQSFTVSFVKPYRISKLFYLPWQDSRMNGVIASYAVLTSMDSVTFDTAATGTWAVDLKQKEAVFTARDAKHVRLSARTANNYNVNADEIGFELADSTTTATGDGLPAVPAWSLETSPNPFNPALIIQYSLPKEDVYRLSVFSVNGKKIRTLEQGWRKPGHYRLSWNGRDNANHPLAGGVYILTLEGTKQLLQKKMIYLK